MTDDGTICVRNLNAGKFCSGNVLRIYIGYKSRERVASFDIISSAKSRMCARARALPRVLENGDVQTTSQISRIVDSRQMVSLLWSVLIDSRAAKKNIDSALRKSISLYTRRSLCW